MPRRLQTVGLPPSAYAVAAAIFETGVPADLGNLPRMVPGRKGMNQAFATIRPIGGGGSGAFFGSWTGAVCAVRAISLLQEPATGCLQLAVTGLPRGYFGSRCIAATWVAPSETNPSESLTMTCRVDSRGRHGPPPFAFHRPAARSRCGIQPNRIGRRLNGRCWDDELTLTTRGGCPIRETGLRDVTDALHRPRWWHTSKQRCPHKCVL